MPTHGHALFGRIGYARDCLDEHRERIGCGTFRRHGLPLTSAHVESGTKQANRRVKGSEKPGKSAPPADRTRGQRLLPKAEAMPTSRRLALSEDGR